MSDEGFYSKRTLKDVVPLSMTQIDRLEKAGDFPQRVRLSGSSHNSRVGWLKRLVHQWVADRTK
jgi:prophage regulatory protein